MNFIRLRTFAVGAATARLWCPGCTVNFLRSNEEQRNGQKKFIAKGFTVPGQPDGLWLSQPRRKGLKRGERRRRGYQQGSAATTKRGMQNGVTPKRPGSITAGLVRAASAFTDAASVMLMLRQGGDGLSAPFPTAQVPGGKSPARRHNRKKPAEQRSQATRHRGGHHYPHQRQRQHRN